MAKKLFSLLLIIALVGAVVWLLSNKSASAPQQPQAQVPVPTPTASPTSEPTAQPKEFTIEAANFKFSVPELKVRQGDTVKLTLKNSEGFHDWRVDEFNAATKVLKAGESQTIEFVADKTGTFEYYCSVGNHRAMGMKGNLVVE